jgi:integrase
VRDIGRIEADRHRSGNARFRVVIESKGTVYRISRKQIAPGLDASFKTHAAASDVLDGIRHLLAKGYSIPRAISQFLPTYSPEDLVENRLSEYLAYFHKLVAQGKRSTTTLGEVERYAQPGGHFSYWTGTNAREITFGQIEDWHVWLGERPNRSNRNRRARLSLKTQKNVSDAFRAFLRRLKRRSEIEAIPEFPAIEVPDYAPRIITLAQQVKILEAIPWERRGFFLGAATEALRVSELRALDLSDYRDGRLRVARTIQGHGTTARVADVTKNRSAEWREIWSPALIEWVGWRVEQATPEDRLRGEIALFPNPTAKNVAKRWTHETATAQWRKACRSVGEDVPLQEGTRHSILTVLASELPERMLQAFSRHRDAKSLSHYTKPRATRASIERIAGVHTKAEIPPRSPRAAKWAEKDE